ncbi:MAG TPA: glycosyltransferase N-terminal domain-containing protein [Segetibacter sp.]
MRHVEDAIKPGDSIIWMHCASLGEFEQGRPVIEKLKIQNVKFKILITFFSPSGYEVRKNYEGADYVFYLPMDSPTNATRFINIVKPKLMLLVKYEFWYYYLSEACKQQIPLLLISGVFRKDQIFFKGHGKLHREMLACFRQIFVQNRSSQDLLASIGFADKVTIAGDTRFDRVIEIAENFTAIDFIEKFIANADVIVAGSTWLEDDEELDHFANTNPRIKFIIAPHNVGKERIDECRALYKRSMLFSEIRNEEFDEEKNVLIIDSIGMLSSLYKYATICYVGGAFGNDGVHNVLEAAVYEKPVVFGPEFEKYIEAEELVEFGGGFTIENALELEQLLQKLLQKDEDYFSAAKASKKYVYNKRGSTDKIINYIQENRLLTS